MDRFLDIFSFNAIDTIKEIKALEKVGSIPFKNRRIQTLKQLLWDNFPLGRQFWEITDWVLEKQIHQKTKSVAIYTQESFRRRLEGQRKWQNRS